MMFLLFLATAACVFADSGSVQAPCNPTQTGFQVSSWPPTVSGSYQYFYYEVRTTSSCSIPLSEILLNVPGCKDCLNLRCGGSIECYDSYWRTLSQCPYSFSWQKQSSFYLSKGYSVSGIKFSVNIYSGRTFRFSLKVPRSYASTTGALWVRGKYFSQCSVPIPICTCGTCAECPTTSYRLNSSCTCIPCTDCSSNAYQVSPCNATSNRICTTCTNCSVGAYETKRCDSTSDRMCSNCTECSAQQYETRPCTSTQNRVCNACTNCLVGTYESKRCNITSDRVCSNCTVCLPGQQYETRMCTLTQNRVCNDCATCVAGETYQARNCSTFQNRLCYNCTNCILGTSYESLPCNVTHNRVCSNCTVCPAGTWMEQQCNATHDTVCRSCTICGVDEQEEAPCTPTNDTVCVPCLVCATCPSNSHLINNGLNCSCNEGFVQDLTAVNFTCVPEPCCGDCFACNFNGSTCANHDVTLCDFNCRLAGGSCGSGSPAGWSASLLSVAYNNSCCGSDGCSCFVYNITNGNGLGIEEFVLGLSCDIFLCSTGGPIPCISGLQPIDSEDTLALIGSVDPPPYIDPRTGIRGVRFTGLALGPGNSWITINFQFLGVVSVSPVPVPYSLFGLQDLNSPCFVSDTFGPDCVVCP